MSHGVIASLLLCAFIGGGLLGCLIGLVKGQDEGKSMTQREAVKRGFAKWAPDEDGECEFEWDQKDTKP